MKILYLWDGFFGKATRNQFEYGVRLKDYCDLVVYGYKMVKGIRRGRYDNLIPLKYTKNLDLKTVISLLRPDVLFMHFQKRAVRSVKLEGLRGITIPKILLDVNSHDGGPKWRNDHKIDLVIYLARNMMKYYGKKVLAKQTWMPLSANEEEFFVDDSIEKIDNKIIGYGSTRGWDKKDAERKEGKRLTSYGTRHHAIQLLRAKKLLANHENIIGAHEHGKGFPEEIRKYRCALTCSLPQAYAAISKTFEYMASGLALLVTKIEPYDVIFGDKQCYFEYNEDTSDLEKVARYVIAPENSDHVQEVARNGYERVINNHMHKHRIKELYNVIETFVNTGEVLHLYED